MSVARHDPVAHAVERLQDLLDERLSPADTAALRAHVEACPSCRAELSRLDAGRTAARASRIEHDLPQGFASELATRLDREDADLHGVSGEAEEQSPTRPPVWQMAAGIALLAGMATWAVSWPGGAGAGRVDVPTFAARDFDQLVRGTTTFGLTTTQAAALQAYFASAGPRARIIDLAMMGYTVTGGRAHTLAGRPSALYAYRGAKDERLVCQMFVGALGDLPPTDDVRQNGPFAFRVYRRGPLTLVFWQEGSLVCVLVSDLPAEEVVKLAMAKAMLPA